MYNFADDNTKSALSKSKDTLLMTIGNESEKEIDWFILDNMIVNLEKFQLMSLQKSGKAETFTVQLDRKIIETKNFVELLGINIDEKLTCGDQISGLCNKVFMQLNAIRRLKRYVG